MTGCIFFKNFPRDGKNIVSTDASTIKMWDVATGDCISTIESGSRSVHFHPDGKSIISADNSDNR